MRPEDVRRALERAGRGNAKPDAAFAESLEQRLRAVHASHAAQHDHEPVAAEGRPAGQQPPAPARAGWRRPWIISPVPVAAAVLLLVVALTSVLRGPAQGSVELAAAYDATVTLPDGRTLTARAGQRLAEGALVRTGPRGHVVVDGVRLGPGEVAVVRHRGLRRVDETARRPGPGRDGGAMSPKPRPAPGGGPVPALPPLRPLPDGRPRPDERPAARPEPSDYAQDKPERDGVAYGRAEPDAAHAMGLAAKLDNRTVVLMWTAFDHPAFARYVVLRSPAPEAPEWPPREGGGTEIIGRVPERDRRHFLDDQLRYRPVYRIVALDEHGRELGRSRAVTPAVPREQPPPEDGEPATSASDSPTQADTMNRPAVEPSPSPSSRETEYSREAAATAPAAAAPDTAASPGTVSPFEATSPFEAAATVPSPR